MLIGMALLATNPTWLVVNQVTVAGCCTARVHLALVGVGWTDLLILALADPSYTCTWIYLTLVGYAASRAIRRYNGLANAMLAAGTRWAEVVGAARARPLCAIAIDSVTSLKAQQRGSMTI